MHAGGAGCISATANVNPLPIRELYKNWNCESAEKSQEKLNQIRMIFQSFPMIPALKAATGIYSKQMEWNTVRPPLMALSVKEIASLKAQLDQVNFSMEGLTN
jgi:4-hydroxy-tetrahydrodipicolinate synthase